MEKGKIYKITNKVNGLVYIGCTICSLEKRYGEHLSRCFTSNYKSKLYNSMKKYGQDNFSIELIEECDLSVIYEFEKKYIDSYDSYNNGLNSTLGGEGCLGYSHSSVIRQKISEKTKNNNPHKNKTYEQLYGDVSDIEKEKRSLSVKKVWESLTFEDKQKRIINNTKSQQKKSKYGFDLVVDIKNKLKEGYKIKQLKELYPDVKEHFFYSIKNGRRWVNI